MSPDSPGGATLESVRRAGVETTGIEIIDEAERTARPADLFWPWFAANVSVFGISYGSFVLDFGISLWQALVVSVLGILISFLLCGLVAVAGKRGSAPTMIISRAAFGVQGQKLPGVVSWIVSIGWETFLAILATLATATVMRELGWGGGTPTKAVAMLVVAALIVTASVAGYHLIMRLQSLLTWLTGLATIVYVLLTVDRIDVSALTALESGSTQQVLGALIMVMTGFGLGWINIAADWSRYQSREAGSGAIVAWNTFGGALAPALLVAYGIGLAGSDADLRAGIAGDPVGTLATILPTWYLVIFGVAAVLALVSGAVLGIYSSGLTLLSLGVRIPRPAAAGLDGILLTLGAIWVVFFAEDFLGPFQSFLITLGVPLAAWAGIFLADLALRREDYDEAALFDARGRYGSIDWVSVATMVAVSVIGWGLVTNAMPDSTWNNWQGYLLKAFMGTELVEDPAGSYWAGDWSYANLGVLAALVLGFVITWVARRPVVRRGRRRAFVAERPALPDLEDAWLVVIDPQRIFADPSSEWGSPMFDAALPQIRGLRSRFGAERTVLTRWVPGADRPGSWGPYFERWSFADRPSTDPAFDLITPAAGWSSRGTVDLTTFGKWGAGLTRITGEHPTLVLAGVSTDCCVISTALPAADAGATIVVAADACAGSSEEAHAAALQVMGLYAPQICVATSSDVAAARARATRSRGA